MTMIFDTVLSYMTAAFPAMNLIAGKVSAKWKIGIFAAVVALDMLLYRVVGQYVNFITLGLMFALIYLALPKNERIMGINYAIAGYLLSIVLNYLLFAALEGMGILYAAGLAGWSYFAFSAGYAIFVCAVTFALGKWLKKRTNMYKGINEYGTLKKLFMWIGIVVFCVCQFMIKQVIDGGLKPEEMQRSTIIFTVFYVILLIIYDMIMREDKKAYKERGAEFKTKAAEEILQRLKKIENTKGDIEIEGETVSKKIAAAILNDALRIIENK